MARIIRRRRALVDLLELHDYITDQAGEGRADAFIRRIEKRLSMASEHPRASRDRSELRAGLRSVVIGRYVAFFFPLDDGIELVRMLYGGRDIPSIFADED